MIHAFMMKYPKNEWGIGINIYFTDFLENTLFLSFSVIKYKLIIEFGGNKK